MNVNIRKLQEKDKETIKKILQESQMFRDEEIDVAVEVIDEYLKNPSGSDYWSYVCTDGSDGVLGFTIFGPNPMTNGTYDLYWIVVDMNHQRKGIGKKMLDFCEKEIHSKGGRLLVAETSSKPTYLRTRKFYKQNGYSELANIKDYYDLGDDLIIYGKYLKEE